MRPRVAIVEEILHRVDVCTVLECRAVLRAASAGRGELRGPRLILAELDATADPREWDDLHLQLHRAINDESGNLVLAEMVEELQREVHWLCREQREDLFTPHGRQLLQSHHRTVLACIEHGRADEGMRYTRAHAHLVRDQVIAALTLHV